MKKKAVLGGGCFWGIENKFQSLKGVVETEVGYAGGTTKNPTYEEVCGKQTNHAEVVKVIFDEEVVSYNEILDFFFKIHDPTQLNRQGWDIGSQYRSIIFATDKAQLEVAEMTKKALEENSTFNKSIATQIEILPNYYKAEEYHQKYILKKMGQVPL